MLLIIPLVYKKAVIVILVAGKAIAGAGLLAFYAVRSATARVAKIEALYRYVLRYNITLQDVMSPFQVSRELAPPRGLKEGPGSANRRPTVGGTSRNVPYLIGS